MEGHREEWGLEFSYRNVGILTGWQGETGRRKSKEDAVEMTKTGQMLFRGPHRQTCRLVIASWSLMRAPIPVELSFRAQMWGLHREDRS